MLVEKLEGQYLTIVLPKDSLSRLTYHDEGFS